MKVNIYSELGSEELMKIFMIAILIMVILLSLPFYFFRGIGLVDDTNFLIIAKWIGEGAELYNDLIELKPPGIYYTLSALQRIFGEAWWISRVFILCINLLFCYLLIKFTTRLAGAIAGILSGIIFYPTLMIFGGYRIHTETICALIGFAALAIVYDKERLSLKRVFLFGIIIGISTLFKQPGIFYLIAFQIFLLLKALKAKISLRDALIFIYISAFGFLTVWLISLIFIYRQGILDGFIYATLVRPFTDRADRNYHYLRGLILVSPLPVLIFSCIYARFKYKGYFSSSFKGADLLWLFAFLLSLIPIFKRSTPHYLICTIFPLAILGAKLWAGLIYKLINDSKLILERHLNLKKILILFLLIFPAFPSLGAVSYGGYFFVRENRIGFDRLQTYELGEKISQYLKPSDTVLCVDPGPCSRIYYILERRPPLRYLIISINDSEKPGKFRELLDFVKTGRFPVVIMVDSIDRTRFTVIDKAELYIELKEKYKQIPLKYPLDLSRNLKIELFVLKELNPNIERFRSSIFP